MLDKIENFNEWYQKSKSKLLIKFIISSVIAYYLNSYTNDNFLLFLQIIFIMKAISNFGILFIDSIKMFNNITYYDDY